MSGASYSTKNYDAAASKYKEMLEKYTGEAGMQKASELASVSAGQAAKTAGASAVANYLAAGYSRSKAAELAQKDASTAYNNAYGNAFSNAVSLNSAKASGYKDFLDNASNIDTNVYQSDINSNADTLGTIGGAMQGVSALAGSANGNSSSSTTTK